MTTINTYIDRHAVTFADVKPGHYFYVADYQNSDVFLKMSSSMAVNISRPLAGDDNHVMAEPVNPHCPVFNVANLKLTVAA